MKNGKSPIKYGGNFRHNFMTRSWFPILVVAGLLGLLAVLATLQYRWLGQISDGERERMKARLETDTRRFAEDFNREIQSAYFSFQMPSEAWREKNWNEFNQRVAIWRERAAHPNLISDFYFVEAGEAQNLSHFNREKGAFEPTQWTDELNNLKPKLAALGAETVDAENLALLMPIFDTDAPVDRIFIRTERPGAVEKHSKHLEPLPLPEKIGVLVIKLDADVLKNQVLSDLVKKYFPESDDASYKVAVTTAAGEPVMQTGAVGAADASAKLFDLTADNFLLLANRELLPKRESGGVVPHKTEMVYSRVESFSQTRREAASPEAPLEEIEIKKLRADAQPAQRLRVFETRAIEPNNQWTLNVQHSSGSLEQFITNARRRNLAVSFGILSLLGVSVVLIFFSAQRARILAQRQVDFVSAVSHEFRTPLAVIYSAGENLSDGVVTGGAQVSQYGGLIKREGKKLSAMVEQILQFAGARSGKRKYDFRPASVEKLLETAIAECRPLIDDQDFDLETEIASNLQKISADENALAQAVQNLIANGLKYSNGSKWLKLSAANGGGKIKIVVEDKGIGIAPKDLAHVFEPFFRAKAVVDEQIHGNGLGLSIVKQIAEAHKGAVKVESELGKGSKFTIELPLQKN